MHSIVRAHAEPGASEAVGAERVPPRAGCGLDPGVDRRPVSSGTEPCRAADLGIDHHVATVVHDPHAEHAVRGAGESGVWWREHVRRQPVRWQPLRLWRHVRRWRAVRRHVWRRHVWRRAVRCIRHARRQGLALGDTPHRADAGRAPYPLTLPLTLRLPLTLTLTLTVIRALTLTLTLARAQMSFGRLTQMLEMNFEVMQHFLGSLVSLVERVRAMYSDARQLTSTVGRQSLEFGESSISTARQAKSRLRRHPHDSNAKPSLTPSLTRTLNPHPHPHPHPNTLTRRHPLGSLALVCFALTLLLRRAWQRKRRLPPVPLPLEGVWSG